MDLSYGIFIDPVFIRRNTLLNFLHSNFPSEDLQQIPIHPFSDLLRTYYHDLKLINDSKERRDSLSLVISKLTNQSDTLSELDWFYCERISIHFANFNRSVPNRVTFLLNRK